MSVIHPKTRAPIPREDGSVVSITLLGRCSETYREAARFVDERRNDAVARGIRQTPQDREAADVDLLIACTQGWTIDQLDNEPFPFNAANCRRLWTDTRFLWLRDQAVVHIQSDGNFLPT